MDRKFINEMKALISWCFEHATVMEDLEFKGFDLDSMYDSLNKELNIKNEFSLQENEIIKKALVEYEENHYEMEDDVWQESINGLISYFNNALYNAFEQQENATKPKIYVAIFNHIGDGYQLLKNYTEVLESKFSKECSVSLVNEDTLCFSGLDGQEISDLMETTGADYNYSYDSAEEAWDVEKIADSYDIGYAYNNQHQEDLTLKKNKEMNLEARLMLDCNDVSYYLTNGASALGTDYILEVNKEDGSITNLGCNMTTTDVTIEDIMEQNLLFGKVQWISNELHYSYRYNESVAPHAKHCVYMYMEWCEEHGVTLEDIREEFPETPDVFSELSVDNVIDKAKEEQGKQMISFVFDGKEKERE